MLPSTTSSTSSKHSSRLLAGSTVQELLLLLIILVMKIVMWLDIRTSTTAPMWPYSTSSEEQVLFLIHPEN